MSDQEKLAIFGGEPVRKSPLSYAHQYIDEDDIQAVVRVLKSDFLTAGPEIEALEKKLCEVTGARYAVVCANGTAALHIACLAAGLQEGDELITTATTFAASSNCALYCGAKPVFADIDPETWNIDPEKVRPLITNKTKVILPVDFTGQAVRLKELRDIAHEKGLLLIEDAAHAIGTVYYEPGTKDGTAASGEAGSVKSDISKGFPVGSYADMTTFSFHPVKNVTGGEGGAVTTNDEGLYQRLLLFRSHGITRNEAVMAEYAKENQGNVSDENAKQENILHNAIVQKNASPWYYEQVELGYNYRMTDMQAALVNSQLEKLSVFKKRRQEIVRRYDEAFSSIPGLIVQKEIPESDTARHLYILRFDRKSFSVSREEIFKALLAEGVQGNVHYIPVYYHPYYQRLGYEKGLCLEAEALYEEIITLPLYYGLTPEDQEDVIRAVKKVAHYYTEQKS
ncbi:MAG: UDP-4-amino-4,6-dideoxy-N-acetyl-beta-L-altrosamine transaminase [Lachnospiraceae bacterium]|nr:UDP-4-amino-4,6-dideoxy-N-acetyl-beta-L-altrosamine transaminase [Lachnospiraceae bacterium]